MAIKKKPKRHDPLTVEQRSERMSRISSSDTKPELFVRQFIYGLGFRYRLHVKELPGRPDIVFRRYKKVIFVHGCFWHQHGCNQYRMPKSKIDFWIPKLQKNVERDKKISRELKKCGWKVLVIWECQLKKVDYLKRRVVNFLEG
ncbi:MAG TPA: DNA mismatch endonuclease Vsr [Gammaproteobacteria bacterium]|nr:DNA mismatch endonuclease Vsr [Gammaproteobacteria bacterium]